jgi:hypothetical protein
VATDSIQSICLESLEDSTHPSPRRLCIGQDVSALLRMDARDSVPGCCQLACHDKVGAVQGNASYRRLLDRRRDMGAAGSIMVSHVLTTSTSRIALRETFFRVDFEPSVATSLASTWLAVDGLCVYRQDERDTRRLQRHIYAR